MSKKPFDYSDYPEFYGDDRDLPGPIIGHTYKRAKTTKTSTFDEGDGRFLVMASGTKRTFAADLGGAVDHAAQLIHNGNCDEFLILKVVARVKMKVAFPPVDVELIKDPVY
jgi:hypothetical protein